jgi:hypothetical protein
MPPAAMEGFADPESKHGHIKQHAYLISWVAKNPIKSISKKPEMWRVSF